MRPQSQSSSSSSANNDSSKQPSGPQKVIDQLNLKAKVPTDSTYTFKTWCSSATKLILQADTHYALKQYEDAYVMYTKALSIIVEIIPKHKNYSKNDPTYKSLSQKAIPILDKVESIKSQILDGTYKVKEPNPTLDTSSQTSKSASKLTNASSLSNNHNHTGLQVSTSVADGPPPPPRSSSISKMSSPGPVSPYGAELPVLQHLSATGLPLGISSSASAAGVPIIRRPNNGYKENVVMNRSVMDLFQSNTSSRNVQSMASYKLSPSLRDPTQSSSTSYNAYPLPSERRSSKASIFDNPYNGFIQQSTPSAISKPSSALSKPSISYPSLRQNSSSELNASSPTSSSMYPFLATAQQPPLPPKASLPPRIKTRSNSAGDINPSISFPPHLPPKPNRMLASPSSSSHNINGTGAALSIASPLLENRFHPSESRFSGLATGSVGITGLKNMGNTCYFNSIVQCLNGTLPLSRYFLSGSFKKHINKENPLGTKGALAVAFAELIRTLWSSSQDTFVVPIKFRDAIGALHTQFSTSDQQDSQEFLAFLLDGLHEDLKLPPASSTPPPEIPDEEFEKLPAHIAAEEAWKRYMFKNSSFVVQLFMGQLRSRLSCLTCGKTSTSYNPFMYLSIPVIKGNRVDLGDCLDEFLREEILEGSDAWHCSNCRTTRRSTKSLTLSKLPDILLIHLKRFSFQGPFRNKLDTLVDFPVKGLDLNLYLGYPEKTGPWIYDLYAVSNHFGGLDGGHYTAVVQNRVLQKWHYFDDTRVSVCNSDEQVVTKAAYNLFYVRRSVDVN